MGDAFSVPFILSWFQLITCWWNPSKGVWHLSEGGTLYLGATWKLREPLRSCLASLRKRYAIFSYLISHWENCLTQVKEPQVSTLLHGKEQTFHCTWRPELLSGNGASECNNAPSTIISYPDSSCFLISGWVRLRQDDAAKYTASRITSRWLSVYQVYITTETGRPGIRRCAWQVISATSVEDLGYVVLFVKSKSELTWSLNCIDTIY